MRERMEIMRNNASLVSIVFCSFGIAGLLIPFQSPADASGLLGAGKNTAKPQSLRASLSEDNCTKTDVNLGGTSTDSGCKPDAQKKSYMEPDRKGHKVKKSKGRSR